MIGRGLLQRLALLLLGLSLSLLTLELGIRGVARLANRDPVLRFDDVLGWSLRPGSRQRYADEEQAYWVEVNSRGLRDREHALEKPPGVVRLVALGDSMTFGAGGIAAENRFTDLLARSANNVEVVNLGVPGYSTDQEYLALQEKGLAYHPDVVLMFLFANDLPESFVSWNPSIGRPKGYVSRRGEELVFHPPEAPALRWLVERSYAIAVGERLGARLWGNRRARASAPALDKGEEIETLRLLLRNTRALAQHAGAEFVAVYLPYRGQSEPNEIERILADLCRTDGLKTLDLTEELKRLDPDGRAYFRRDIHLNEVGNQAVAQAVREYLVANHLLVASR